MAQKCKCDKLPKRFIAGGVTQCPDCEAIHMSYATSEQYDDNTHDVTWQKITGD